MTPPLHTTAETRDNTTSTPLSNAYGIAYFIELLRDRKQQLISFRRDLEDNHALFLDIVDERSHEIEAVTRSALRKGEVLMKLIRRRNPTRDGPRKRHLKQAIENCKISVHEIKEGLEDEFRAYEEINGRQRKFLRELKEEVQKIRLALEAEMTGANNPIVEEAQGGR